MKKENDPGPDVQTEFEWQTFLFLRVYSSIRLVFWNTFLSTRSYLLQDEKGTWLISNCFRRIPSQPHLGKGIPLSAREGDPTWC